MLLPRQSQLFQDEVGRRSGGAGNTKDSQKLFAELRSFREFGEETAEINIPFFDGEGREASVPGFVNEFWTAKQRAAHSLHEVSYRACFKPQLPRFFMERLTLPDETVYDPFMGRGTTLVEAALCGRIPLGCDVNPLSAMLVRPRLEPPRLDEIAARLAKINFSDGDEFSEDLSAFYHPDTLKQIRALKNYLHSRHANHEMDMIDQWIRMVAINRLSGHSPGFFSVYTMPPNQAVSVEVQRKINAKRDQSPPRRDVPKIIIKKSKALLKDLTLEDAQVLRKSSINAKLLTGGAAHTPGLEPSSVSLVVTSPPFLDVVNYAADNWLRCWFAGIDPKSVPITMSRKLEDWKKAMTEVFMELRRVLKPGGWVAFEVGEVHGGKMKLEEAVLPCGQAAGLEPVLVMINAQNFTKTANCWGVENNAKGTNTNRIVVFRKT